MITIKKQGSYLIRVPNDIIYIVPEIFKQLIRTFKFILMHC